MRKTGFEVLVRNPWAQPTQDELMADRIGIGSARFDTRYDPAGVWDMVSRQLLDPQEGLNPTAGLAGMRDDPRVFHEADLAGLRSGLKRLKKRLKRGWKRLGRSSVGRVFRTGLSLFAFQGIGRMLGGAIGGRAGGGLIRATRFFGGPRAGATGVPRRPGGHLWRLFGGNTAGAASAAARTGTAAGSAQTTVASIASQVAGLGLPSGVVGEVTPLLQTAIASAPLRRQNVLQQLMQQGLSAVVAGRLQGGQPLSAEDRAEVAAADQRRHELDLAMLNHQAGLERERIRAAGAAEAIAAARMGGDGFVPTDIPLDSPIVDTNRFIADIAEQERLAAKKKATKETQFVFVLAVVAAAVYYYYKKKR